MKKPFIALLLLLGAATAPPSSPKGAHSPSPRSEVTIQSDQPYVQDRYAAMPGPWSRYLDPSNKVLSDSILIRKASFPRNTFMRWEFPDHPATTGVYGYNYVAYGQYWNLKPPVTVEPRRLKDIKALTFQPSVRTAGDDADFNVLAEFFTTRKAGDIDSRTAEIGWLLHAPPATWTYIRSGKQIGTYKDRYGARWLVASHKDGAAGLYIKFVPKDGSTRLHARVDALGSIRWLAAKGEIDPSFYFNGVAVGVEPLKGGGSATIDRFDVAYR
ncbi:MAG TPA: hypothetical protein VF503_19145 [Sphingobium sp.]|uniref:hypothetical protein n=1 Tax=Sphingobium sp. TaxID=1912891 RepID=UPI002ED106F6